MKHLALLASAVALGACSEIEQPKNIAEQYWQAMIDNDLETARALVSTASQDAFDIHAQAVNSPDALSQVALDDQRIVVVTTINPDVDKPWRDRPFETVMVLEDGEWRIDLNATELSPAPTELERQLEDMTNDMNGTLEKNLDTMEQLLEEGADLLDESIEQGSREMSQTFQDAMRKMQESIRDSIEQMKQRRENRQAPPAEPDADTGEGVI